MLNNINEINITLKAQQTSLQEEIRDKNAIIRYLKFFAWDWSKFSVFENQITKSIKTLNSLLFKDLLQNVNNWLSRMQNKLKNYKNYFSIKELKIVYIES